MRGFPLFPLGLVALPGEQIPLHVFEDRFLGMVEHCLSAEAEFGILWVSDEQLVEIGCACRIETVSERSEDGPMDILARGTRRFRLLAGEHDLPHPSGSVEWLSDLEEPLDEQALEQAHELYRGLVEQATERVPAPAELDRMSSYQMAAAVGFDAATKQQLLELRSESARLRLLVLLLRSAIKRLELLERAQARAQTNGKVRFG